MNRFLKHLAVWLWWLIAGCVISVALLLGVARLILPSVADYRSNVEGWLSDYHEQRVKVDSLDLRWRGFGPQLTLRGLQVADSASGSVMFGVHQAYVDTDLWNLLLGRQGVVRDIELAGFALQILCESAPSYCDIVKQISQAANVSLRASFGRCDQLVLTGMSLATASQRDALKRCVQGKQEAGVTVEMAMRDQDHIGLHFG